MKTKQKCRKWLRPLLLLGIMSLLFLYTAIRIVNWIDYPNTDFFSYWLGARMMWTGESPYNETQWVEGHHVYGATWISDLAYLYPLPLAILMAPLGLLSLKEAFAVWIMISEALIVASAWLLFRLWRTNTVKPYVFPVAAGIILFRPVIITLTGGQFGTALLFILCSTLFLWEKERWFWGSLLLSLLILKPNTGFFILAFSAIWLLFQQRWNGLAGMLLGGLSLLGIGLLRDPGWVEAYFLIGNRKIAETFGFSPTLWGLAAGICNFQRTCTLTAGWFSVILLVSITFTLLFRKNFSASPALPLSLIVCLVLSVTPYIWPYDQILLILPLLLFIGYLVIHRTRFILSGALFLVFDLITLGLLLITAQIQKEIWNGLLPLICYGLLAYSIYRQSNKKTAAFP